ncbi:hypothetical protein CONPUDRAFT_85716 [Coniophora puteana RWD-64-598 SS2]|uniref:Uncharacterized protein n=1 Tax=Coniophora puteana (strain RWD-64-598) TaxID=741705 RepID=R7SHH2_CONPW|nr:uncharacterized protein CONPUDRAFT_85716 [Coniophora puteana RWD-64-598 SS2]EIW74519.1 hypothetical protein CONPUDRAFT_85716 [Coniophora puteana RWD-64-598 SS2]
MRRIFPLPSSLHLLALRRLRIMFQPLPVPLGATSLNHILVLPLLDRPLLSDALHLASKQTVFAS